MVFLAIIQNQTQEEVETIAKVLNGEEFYETNTKDKDEDRYVEWKVSTMDFSTINLNKAQEKMEAITKVLNKGKFIESNKVDGDDDKDVERDGNHC